MSVCVDSICPFFFSFRATSLLFLLAMLRVRFGIAFWPLYRSHAATGAAALRYDHVHPLPQRLEPLSRLRSFGELLIMLALLILGRSSTAVLLLRVPPSLPVWSKERLDVQCVDLVE